MNKHLSIFRAFGAIKKSWQWVYQIASITNTTFYALNINGMGVSPCTYYSSSSLPLSLQLLSLSGQQSSKSVSSVPSPSLSSDRLLSVDRWRAYKDLYAQPTCRRAKRQCVVFGPSCGFSELSCQRSQLTATFSGLFTFTNKAALSIADARQDTPIRLSATHDCPGCSIWLVRCPTLNRSIMSAAV